MNCAGYISIAVLLLLSTTGSPASSQGWSTEVAVTFGNHSDLAVDGDGTPHIVSTNCDLWEECTESGQADLLYATKQQGIWVTESIAGDPAGSLTAITIDQLDQPHIAYCDSLGQMHYGYRLGGS